MNNKTEIADALESIVAKAHGACGKFTDINMPRSEFALLMNKAAYMLKAQPEVVRCKDCKHSTMTADGKLCKYCDFYKEDDGSPMQLYHEGDWFCADGERKDGR